MMKKLLKMAEIATLLKSAQFPNYKRCRSQILIAETEDFNKGYVKIVCPYFLYFPKKKPSKSITIGPGRFIVLSDSASPT